jgi:putative DNA primase/helicase
MAFIAIPAELCAVPQWLIWRDRKVPYCPTSPTKLASVTDPSTWADYATAAHAAELQGHGGVGFVLTAADNFCGVDLDNCITDGYVHPAAQAVLDQLGTYTEVSPSGNGLRLVLHGRKPGPRCKVPVADWGGPFEVYDDKRFLTMTGHHLPNNPTTVNDRQVQLDQLYNAMFPPEAPSGPRPASRPVSADDRQLVARAHAAANGLKFAALWRGDTSLHGGDDSAADLALVAMLVYWAGPDTERVDHLFRSSGLMREKWDRQTGDTTYGARTIARALGGVLPTAASSHSSRFDFAAAEPWPVELYSDEPADPPQGEGGDDPHGPPPDGTFRLLGFDDLLNMPDPPWLIDHLVPEGLSVIYGAPATYKSFLALDWALCVATGQPWHGHAVNAGHVVYVVAEGRGGLKKRVMAWWAANGKPDMSRAHFIPEAVNLLDAGQVEMARRTLASLPEPARLLVVDTMARSMVGGDENSARDVGTFIANLDSLPVSARLVVHHSGKDGAERGSSALRGAADLMLRIGRDGQAIEIDLVWDKPKDFDAWPTIRLHRELVGDSCVLTLVAAPDHRQAAADDRHAAVLAFVAENGPASKNKVEQGVGGKAALVRQTIDLLIREGLIRETQKGRTKELEVVRLTLGEEMGTNSPQAPLDGGSSPWGVDPVGVPQSGRTPPASDDTFVPGTTETTDQPGISTRDLIEPSCTRPDHRPSDWALAGADMWSCGVCHPPADPMAPELLWRDGRPS